MADIFKTIFNRTMLGLGRAIERRRFSELPIVIGASPRSGTTLLLSILDAHPQIFAIPNQTYAFDIWEENNSGEGDGEKNWQPVRIDRLYREFVLNRIAKTAKRWCEKTPKNIQHFDKILSYYGGNVKLIHIIRDGRDVVTSKHPKHNPGQYWVPIERWKNDVRLGLKLKDYPSVLTLRYEDLVNNYDDSMKNVCRFIEAPFVTELHNWLNYTKIRKSKHLKNPVQDLYKDSIGRWRLPEHQNRLQEFMRDAEAIELLKQLDYEI